MNKLTRGMRFDDRLPILADARFIELLRLMAAQLPAMNAFQLVNSMHSCAAMGVRLGALPKLMDGFDAAVLRLVGEFNDRDCCSCWHAYATLGHTPSDAVLAALAARSHSQLEGGRVSAHGVSMLLWSAAKLGCIRVPAAGAMVGAALALLEHGKSSAAASSASSSSQASSEATTSSRAGSSSSTQRGSPAQAEAASTSRAGGGRDEGGRGLHRELTPQGMANVAWAAAKMGVSRPSLLKVGGGPRRGERAGHMPPSPGVPCCSAASPGPAGGQVEAASRSHLPPSLPPQPQPLPTKCRAVHCTSSARPARPPALRRARLPRHSAGRLARDQRQGSCVEAAGGAQRAVGVREGTLPPPGVCPPCPRHSTHHSSAWL